LRPAPDEALAAEVFASEGIEAKVFRGVRAPLSVAL
jgi:hypothetical protein